MALQFRKSWKIQNTSGRSFKYWLIDWLIDWTVFVDAAVVVVVTVIVAVVCYCYCFLLSLLLCSLKDLKTVTTFQTFSDFQVSVRPKQCTRDCTRYVHKRTALRTIWTIIDHPLTLATKVRKAIKSTCALYPAPRSAIPYSMGSTESIEKNERRRSCNIKHHYSLNLFRRERLMMLSLRFMGPSIDILSLLRWLNRQSSPTPWVTTTCHSCVLPQLWSVLTS